MCEFSASRHFAKTDLPAPALRNYKVSTFAELDDG
jgi:hypothetical protein